MRKWLIASVVLFVLAAGLIFASDYMITRGASEYVYDDMDAVPCNRVGLLLGTSKYAYGGKNLYFYNRISATASLYKSGRIGYIVISGDNRQKNYNEPQDMKDELLSAGIPESRIFLDYAGFRTYDSIYRMDKIFGQKSFTVISQRFHNQRAVYIARSLGLRASGFNAADVDAYYGFRTNVREKFARVKVFIDFATGKKPKFLGEPIEIRAD